MHHPGKVVFIDNLDVNAQCEGQLRRYLIT
jgi:hypothetical protein